MSRHISSYKMVFVLVHGSWVMTKLHCHSPSVQITIIKIFLYFDRTTAALEDLALFIICTEHSCFCHCILKMSCNLFMLWSCLAAISTHSFKWREHHVSWITKPVVCYFSFALALIVLNLWCCWTFWLLLLLLLYICPHMYHMTLISIL